MADSPAINETRDPSPESATAALPQPHATHADVWSRTEPRYRIRAVTLLVVNIVLFWGLCIFTFWLRTAESLNFSLSSYFAPARFWESTSPNLYDYTLAPISVEAVPIHGVVLGVLLGALVAMPIVIAILYRFAAAIPFLLAVLVFAHMPWMSFTLLISCILAAVPPFRMRFRFASALLAMLPVLIYFMLASRGGPQEVVGVMSPVQKSLLVAPWVLALLSSCAMQGLVLRIARLVDYRPGAVAPVMATMFALPVLLFHTQVGMDELEFRVLEAQFGPHTTRFRPVETIADTQARVDRVFARHPAYSRFSDDDRGLFEELAVRFAEVRGVARELLRAELFADRRAGLVACQRFLDRHPDSRYVPSVLYIEGRILDTRLEVAALSEVPPRRRLYTDFPHRESEIAWSTLYEKHPKSPLSAMAALRLAQLQLRRGEAEPALAMLEAVIQRFDDPAARRDPTESLLGIRPPKESLGYELQPTLRECRRLAQLIRENAGDPRWGATPLKELARLDPRRPMYERQVLRLADRYAASLLWDNLLVLWANHAATIEKRAERLRGTLRKFRTGDAVPQAMYHLAELEAFALARSDARLRSRAIERYRRLVNEYPETFWGRAARRRLELLDPDAATRSSQPEGHS